MIAIEFATPDITITGRDDKKAILLAEWMVRREYRSGGRAEIARIFGDKESVVTDAKGYLHGVELELRTEFLPATVEINRQVGTPEDGPPAPPLILLGKLPKLRHLLDAPAEAPAEPVERVARRGLRKPRGQRYLDRMPVYARPKAQAVEPAAAAQRIPVKRRWRRQTRP